MLRTVYRPEDHPTRIANINELYHNTTIVFIAGTVNVGISSYMPEIIYMRRECMLQRVLKLLRRSE